MNAATSALKDDPGVDATMGKAALEVSVRAEGLFIALGDGLLVRNGQAAAQLGAGWSPRFAYMALAPFILLELQHDTGQHASWILDAHGSRVAGAVAELGPDQQAALLALARPVMRAAVLSLLADADPAESALAFFAVGQPMRQELWRLCGQPALPVPRAVALEACGNVVVTGTAGRVTLMQEALAACLSAPLHGRYLEGCRTGRMSWPSVAGGAAAEEVRGMVLFPLLEAWRCVDRTHGLVFYVLAAGFRQESAALWIPAAGLLVMAPQHGAAAFTVEPAPLLQWLGDHVLTHGAALAAFLSNPVRRIAHYTWPRGSAHIGHYLWQELSGLERVVQDLDSANYPLIYDVGGAGGSAFYGPLSLVFPEFQGLIVQDHAGLAEMSAAAYLRGVQVLRFSGGFISAELRQRIGNVVAATAAAEQARAALASAAGPVVVFGLRVENRTVVDQAQFYAAVARRLAQRFGQVTIILDGHNRRADAGPAAMHESFLEHRAVKKPVDVEHEVAAQIKAALQGHAATVIDCVGMTMLDNLAWLACADYCVAPWGAGLAKYRWVCNLPSYVLVSDFNRKHKNDIDIYHSPAFTEAPALLDFVGAALVTDRPDAEVLLVMDPVHRPYYENYQVDAGAAAAEIVGHIAALADAAGTWRRPVAHAAFEIVGDVVIGRGGQLFLANGGHDILSHVLGQRAPVSSSFANFSVNIATRIRMTAALGARYAHVIFPDKQTVLREAFGVADPICLGTLYAERCGAVWDRVVYPWEALRDGPPGSFLRTDTHLSFQGTLIVADAVLQRLFGTACDGFVAAMRTAPRGRRVYAGDLGRKLTPVQDEEQIFVQHNPAIKVWSNALNSGNNGAMLVFRLVGAPRAERLMILGDSFGADLASLLSHLFQEVVFLRTPYWHPEMVTMIRPDVVITGNVERYLSHVLADSERPEFNMMNATVHGETPERRDFARALSAQASFGRAPYRRWLDQLEFGAK